MLDPYFRTRQIRIASLKLAITILLLIVSLALIWQSAVPARAAVSLSITSPYIQNFDSMGTSAIATLPTDWRVSKDAVNVRTVGVYSTATTQTERTAGNNMSTSAGNGIYNYAAGDPVIATDRALGFLSSGSGTRSGNLYVQLHNDTGYTLESLTISYDIEKYRNGSNPAGYSIQLYYSFNGTSWSSAGTNFITSFPADANNNGFPSAPGVTVSIANRSLVVLIPNGSDFYLAWNYSVTSGTSTTNAQGLGIDNFSVLGVPRGIKISKIAPSIVMPGDAYIYTLTITNGLPISLTNVMITDTLPANTIFVSASDSGQFVDSTVRWMVPALASGAVVNRTFQVEATTLAGLTITNDDYQVHASNWPTPTVGVAVNTIVSPLDVSISKTAPQFAIGGEPFVYEIQLGLDGSVTASDIQITDTLPVNVSYVSDTSGIIPSLLPPGLVVWHIGDVLSTTHQITFTLTVTPSYSIPNNTLITNQVTVSTHTLGDPTNNNTAQAQTRIYQTVPIATARAGAPPSVFAIKGQVTFLPGTYSASDWGLQDASGGIVGYFNPPPQLALGDYVQLIATRSDYSGQEEMGAPVLYFANLGHGPEVAPTNYTTGQVAAGTSEGWLVHIEGIVSNLGACTGASDYGFNVNDGTGLATVFIDRDTGINVCNMGAMNGKMICINGFSSQYSATYEVKPRRSTDIDVDANQPSITKQAPSTVVPGWVFTYTITVQNRLGYTLSNVTVVDNLPANVTSREGGMILRSLGTLADRNQIGFSFPVTATDQITVAINNSYYVTATEFLTPTFGDMVSTFIVSGSLQIHDIQGSGHTSPFVGQMVENIRGVVTMLTTSGFYMQCNTPDANPDTSEGILIYTGSAPTIHVGDDVSLSGPVSEYNGMTELSGITGLTIHGTGITIIPTPVSLPVPVGKDLEPYESMLVVFPQLLTADQNYFQGRYGQVTLSSGRMYNPTNGNGLGDTTEYNQRRMIVLDDASSVQYPNPIPYIGQDNTLRAGDSVAGIIGIVDYGPINSDTSIRFYRLQPIITPVFTRINERTTAPDEVGGSVKVASENVMNYFNGDGLGGGFPTPRGATTYAEFVRQRTKIITETISLGADIVGLMEIENDGDDTLSAIQDLVNGLNNSSLPGTYNFIAEPAPGTDQIKVAMIYKPAVVTPLGPAINYQVTDDPVYHLLFDRPPLVQLFSVNATGEKFYVIVNHFKSKSSCPTSPTDPDADYGQGCWNVKRVAQANGLLGLVAQLQASTGEADALIIGDLNSYGQEDPILTLTGGGLMNELAERVPAVERYSYVFDGQSGYLDQALATPSLDEQLSGATIWHINADEPDVINYTLANKPQDLFTPTPYRASDHDPVLAGLDLRPAALVIDNTVTPDSGVELGGVVTYTVTVSNQADVSAPGVVVTDALPTEVTFGGWIVQNGASEAGNQWMWAGTIPGSGSINFVFTATLGTDPALYGKTVTNVAYFTSTDDGSGSSAASFQVINAPTLNIYKSVEFSNDPPAPGDSITYTVNVGNAGPSTAWDVHITDALPFGLIGGNVDVTSTISAGYSYEIVIPAVLETDYALYGMTITNTAMYTCPGVSNGMADISFDVVVAPVLNIQKTVELAHNPALPGDPITYTIILSNASPAQTLDVHVTDVLPDEVIGSDVNVPVRVPANGEYQLSVPAMLSQQVPFGTIVTNTTVFSYMGVLTGQDSVAFTVVGPPLLHISKTVELSRDPVQPGDPITYTIQVSNRGPSDAVGVHIVDELPVIIVGSSVNITVTVAAGVDYTIIIPAHVAEDAEYDAEVNNVAFYEYMDLTGQAEASFVVAGGPVLSVVKDVQLTSDPAQPGDPITYTVTVYNMGESDAFDVHIVDDLPAEVDGANLDVSVTIPAESSYVIIIPAVISADAGSGITVTNTAYVHHASGDFSTSVSFDMILRFQVFIPVVLRNYPEGGKIVFVSERDGNSEIYAMKADGSNVVRVTNNPASDSCPRWSPDGTKIAFLSDRNSDFELYVMNADGTGITQLTEDNQRSYTCPNWSPVGTKIAFVSWLPTTVEQVYTMNPDGSDIAQITNIPIGISSDAVWSPDGSKIAYSTRESNIYTMNVDGSEPTLLYHYTGLLASFDWSPDGNLLLLSIFVGNSGTQLFVYNISSGTLTQITDEVGVHNSPCWSPYGSKIAFMSNRDGNFEIYTMNANGTDIAPITQGPGGNSGPDWVH